MATYVSITALTNDLETLIEGKLIGRLMARRRLSKFRTDFEQFTVSGTAFNTFKFEGNGNQYQNLQTTWEALQEYAKLPVTGNVGGPDWQAFFQSLAEFVKNLAPLIEMIIKIFKVV